VRITRPLSLRPSPPALELALAVAVAVAFADSSIVVLALPELYIDFETSIPKISWVITGYNLAVVVAALCFLPFVLRARPARTAVVGLTIFLAASAACALADGLAWLVAARILQGVGAALLLGASLPLLVAISGRERGIVVWVGAGTLGTALGPVLGGLLTEIFNWRAIFAFQAPVVAAALAAAFHPATRGVNPAPARPRAPMRLGASLELVLLFAALVGALFLAVLLVVTVWDYGPLAGAGVVSTLPLAAFAARPLARRLPTSVNVISGCFLLAAGLAALALLPSTEAVYPVLALALGGIGLGLALSPLTRASLSGDDLARRGVLSVGVRHLGLVVGLAAVAPLLAAEVDKAEQRATRSATAVILDARLPLEQKVPLALDLYDTFQHTPEGEIPDLSAPFEVNGVAPEPAVREVRDSLLATVEASLSRAFRSSFALTALFALVAGIAALVAVRREPA
jgi:MFS family permease